MNPGSESDALPVAEEVAEGPEEKTGNEMHVSLMTRFRRKRVVIELVIDAEQYDDPHEWPWKEILGFNGTLRYDRAKITSVSSEDLGSMLKQ